MQSYKAPPTLHTYTYSVLINEIGIYKQAFFQVDLGTAIFQLQLHNQGQVLPSSFVSTHLQIIVGSLLL